MQKRPITIEDLYNIVTIEDPRISPDSRWIAYVQVTIDKFENEYRRNIWLVSTEDGLPIQLTRGGMDSHPRWSPDGRALAFVSTRNKSSQIYLLPVISPGGEARQLTKLLNGAHHPVWSPDGGQIAFLSPANSAERAQEDSGEAPPAPADKLDSKHRDERREHDETKRFDPRIIRHIPYREGTAYLDGRYAQVYVVSIADAEAKPRRLTKLDVKYEPPVWSADGESIFTWRSAYPERDEPRRWNSIYRIRVADGNEQRLTGDDSNASEPMPSPDGRWIAFRRKPMEQQAERLHRLVLLPIAGGDVRDLTITFDREVDSGSIRWTDDSQALTFTAGSEGSREIYRVTVANSEVEKVIGGVYEATAIDVAPDGGIAYAVSTPANPSELMWQPANSREPRQMTRANTDFLDQVIVQEPQELHFTSPSGQEIQSWYMLPVGYEPGQTYPLAFNIHGGPAAMWGSATPSMWHEWQVHAASGYAVFFCNPRGGDGYGEAFRAALHAAWGEVAYADLMAGVDAVIEKGFIDTRRMAVTGGSYGGYMTAWIVGHTDRFAAAVAQRGVYNLLSFYGVTDIPLFLIDHFDATPAQDPTRLWQQSPLAYADQVTTPLLIIHSENDFRVPISDSEQLFSNIKLRSGEVEFIRYPRDGHELSRSGEPQHRVSRLQHMVAWFDKYCKE